MNLRSRLTWVRPFLVLALVVTVPLVLYWFGYVGRSVDAAMRQFNTTVAAVATSLEERLQAHERIAQTAEKPRGNADVPDAAGYLLSLVEGTAPTETEETHHLRVAEDGRGLLLSVGGASKAVTTVNIKLENLIPWDIVEAEFDGLVVLSDSGKLLAQDWRLPPQARGLPLPVMRNGQPTDLQDLFDEADRGGGTSAARGGSPAGAAAGASPAAAAGSGDSRWRSPADFSRYDSVTIAGKRYLAFLQPLRVHTAPVAGAPCASQPAENCKVDLLIVGLVAEDRMLSRSRELSPQTLSQVFALVSLGLFLIPFLKLRFIGANERMRYRDFWVMAGAMLGMTAVVALLILDGPSTSSLRAGFDKGLRQLHQEIRDRAAMEAALAVEQLKAATGLDKYCEALGLVASPLTGAGPCTTQAPGNAQPIEGGLGAMLLGADPVAYPLLDTIFLATSSGLQVFKWSPRTITTGRVNVGSRRYFRDALGLAPNQGTDADGAAVAREFVVSQTSGQEQMVFALPVHRSTGEMGAIVNESSRQWVAAITTPMRALSRTIVPSPYEFVFLDRDGTVTFRNAKGPYLRERFLEQVRGGAVLAPASLEGAGEAGVSGDFTYRWRDHRMLASYVPALQMTLVTFYDIETARQMSARAFGVAAVVALAAILSTLIGSLVATLVWGRQAHDWLWPDSEDTSRYVMGIAVCVLATIVLVVLRQLLPASWFAVGVLVVPGLVTVLCGSPLWFRTRLRWRMKEDHDTPAVHKAAFCGFLLSMLLALVAAPTVLAFDDALRLYSAAYQRVAALQWSREVDATAQRFASEYALVAADGDSGRGATGCRAPGRICANPGHHELLVRKLVDPSDTLPGATLAAAGGAGRPAVNWDLYSDCRAPFQAPQRGDHLDAGGRNCGLVLAPAAGTRLPWSFTSLFARPISGLGDAGPWYARALDGQSSWSSWPASGWPLSGWTWTRWWPLWIAAGLALLVFLVHSVAVHILGLGWRNQRLLDASECIDPKDGSRWLLIRPTRPCLSRLGAGRTRVADLRRGGTSPELAAPTAGEVLLVEHVEAALVDDKLRKSLLALAAAPVDGCLIFCTEVDPLFHVSQRAREALETDVGSESPTQEERLARQRSCVELQAQRTAWAEALRDFHKVRMNPPKFPWLGDHVPPEIWALLEEECGGSGPLIEIAQRLAKSRDLAGHREDEIIGFVLDAAEPYYRSVWDLCSRDERLVLVQLAEEGVVNPKRFDIVRRLHHRGLVDVDPRFALMNRSFLQFVRSVETPERVSEWEQTQAGLGWKRLATPLYTLAAVVIAILLYTQQNLFSQMLAIATGAAGALNSLRSLGLLARAPGAADKKTATV